MIIAEITIIIIIGAIIGYKSGNLESEAIVSGFFGAYAGCMIALVITIIQVEVFEYKFPHITYTEQLKQKDNSQYYLEQTFDSDGNKIYKVALNTGEEIKLTNNNTLVHYNYDKEPYIAITEPSKASKIWLLDNTHTYEVFLNNKEQIENQ